jgi:cell division protein FtsQ
MSDTVYYDIAGTAQSGYFHARRSAAAAGADSAEANGADSAAVDGAGGAAAGGRVEKVFRRIFGVCLLLLCVELVWLFGIRPCMPLSHIEVAGAKSVDKKALLLHAGITPSTSYVAVRSGDLERKLAFWPGVEKAEVTKVFPGTLRIKLTPMTPVALSLGVLDGKVQVVYINKRGGVFSAYGGEAPLLPVISGLDEHVGASRLPAIYTPLFESLSTLVKSAPELLQSVSEIQIDKKGYNAFDLIVIPEFGKTRVRMGAVLDEDRLRYMRLLLDVLASTKADIDEIDFRTGTASYKAREGI